MYEMGEVLVIALTFFFGGVKLGRSVSEREYSKTLEDSDECVAFWQARAFESDLKDEVIRLLREELDGARHGNSDGGFDVPT